jgi:SPP1 family predicted phage head-tail adaptor
MIAAGALNKRVQLATISKITDAAGQEVLTPVPGDTVWASIDSLQGRELFQAQQFVSDVSHLVTISYHAGNFGGALVLYGLRKFQVQAAMNPKEQGESLKLLCLEINGAN